MNKKHFRGTVFGLQNDPFHELFDGMTFNSKMVNILLKSPRFFMVKTHNTPFVEAKTPIWVNVF